LNSQLEEGVISQEEYQSALLKTAEALEIQSAKVKAL